MTKKQATPHEVIRIGPAGKFQTKFKNYSVEIPRLAKGEADLTPAGIIRHLLASYPHGVRIDTCNNEIHGDTDADWKKMRR